MNSDGNKERNKEENRKALKIFIPVIIASAAAGGIIGGFSGTDFAVSLADEISEILKKAVYVSSPYMLMLTVILGAAAGTAYLRSAAGVYENCGRVEDEEEQLNMLRDADEKISKGMMAVSISEIVALIFMGVLIAYINSYMEHTAKAYAAALIVFCAGSFMRLKLQQKMIDFQKTMNPEKRGSVYDLNFRKKWEESCDELEKLMIYKASYKAYKAAMTSCAAAFIIVMLSSLLFGYGPLPSTAIGIIWLIVAMTYCREAIRLGKEKINL